MLFEVDMKNGLILTITGFSKFPIDSLPLPLRCRRTPAPGLSDSF